MFISGCVQFKFPPLPLLRQGFFEFISSSDFSLDTFYFFSCTQKHYTRQEFKFYEVNIKFTTLQSQSKPNSNKCFTVMCSLMKKRVTKFNFLFFVVVTTDIFLMSFEKQRIFFNNFGADDSLKEIKQLYNYPGFCVAHENVYKGKHCVHQSAGFVHLFIYYLSSFIVIISYLSFVLL